jgi:FRG domain
LSAEAVPVPEPKDIYGRFSILDKRYADRGIPVARRRSLWSALDQDPMIAGMLADHTIDRRVRDRLRTDFTECRQIRAAAFGERTWCATSIYELLLALFFLVPSSDDFVFRGHLDAEWRLIPSFFRMTPRASLLLHARMVYGAYRWAERRVGKELKLTPFGAEAAAQHYGAGTTLLDVTESLRIAAYFATTPLRETDRQGDFGAVYVLGVDDLMRSGRSLLRGSDLPPELARIHRTQGAFISGIGVHDAVGHRPAPVVESAADIVEWLNASEHKITYMEEGGLGVEESLATGRFTESSEVRFRQTGERFEDPVWGVSRSHLGDDRPVLGAE